MQNKQKIKEFALVYLVAIIILLAVTTLVSIYKPTITGFATSEKQFNYSDIINLDFEESFEYIWIPEHIGTIKSIKLSGSYKTEGNVKVYLEDKDIRYLIFDSNRLEEQGLGGITGFATLNIPNINESNNNILNNNIINETNNNINNPIINKTNQNNNIKNDSNETIINENNIISNETINQTIINDTLIINETIIENETIEINETPIVNETNITIINETIEEIINKTISINLEYKPDSVYDSNNDGIEDISGIIDLTVENTYFNWNVNEENLCTRWETYSVGNEESTIVCYGSQKCCNFVDLMVTRQQWNEPFYSAYGQYGATSNNIVSAQVLYVDYNLSIDEPFAEIYNSEWQELSTKFTEEFTSFKNICIETCALNLNKTNYKLIIEIENSTLKLDKIDYIIAEIKEENNAPILIKDISNQTLAGDKLVINLSEYFIDSDEDLLNYNYYKADNITISFENNMATIVPDKGFEGIVYTFFTANDSVETAVSNVFSITVTNVTISITKESMQGQAEINKPVKWIKKSKNKTISIPDFAYNLSINKIINNEKISIEKNKIKAKYEGMLKSLDEYEISKELEKKEKLKEAENETTIIINETADSYEVIYETEAPISQETDISLNKKIITISAPDELGYKDILAYTYLPIEVSGDRVRLYHLVNETKEEVQFMTYDKNENSLIDYIEWIVPHLSNETYELIIEISKAEHLDENRSFISDIYNETYKLDGIWSEEIPSEHYVRVTFERNLTSERDITLYPRIVNGTPKIEVYEVDGTDLIAEFTSINSNQHNKIFLTNLQGSQDVFDLKIVSGSIELDHIIDPSTIVSINADADSEATGSDGFTENLGKNIIRLDNNSLVAFWSDATQDPSCSISTDEGASWGALQTVTGNEDGMALATNGSNIMYVGTSLGNGAGDLGYRHNVGGTCTTGAFTDIHTDSLDNWKPDVAFDEVHDRYVVCSMDNDDLDLDYAYTSAASISWTSVPGMSGAVSSTSCSIDADDNGNVFIASNEGASGIRVYNSSAGTFASTTITTAYSSAVSNMHLSIRGTKILITAIDSATSDLVVINSSDGVTYSSTTYEGTFQDPEGCIDENGNFHIAFINGSVLDYIRYSEGSFDNEETITDTGTERYPSVRCTNFPSNNRLGSSELELVFTDTGTTIYFANITINTSLVEEDTTAPSGNITIVNNTVYNQTHYINLSQLWNESGSGEIIINGTVNGTLTITAGINHTFLFNATNGTYGVWANNTDASGNEGMTPFKVFTVANNTGVEAVIDNTPPIINATLNKSLTSIYQNDIINISANITDDTGLSFCQFIHNQTGIKNYTNVTLSGTSAQCSNVTAIKVSAGNVINFTIRANDTSNNFRTNDTIITVADNVLPIVNISINKSLTNIFQNDIINISANITDNVGLSFCQFIHNQTGIKNYTNVTLSGTSAQCSNVTEITVSAGNVINFTIRANDTSNNFRTNDTIITVASAATAPSIKLINVTDFAVDPSSGGTTVILISFNVTDADGISNINASKAVVNFTLGGRNGQWRSNVSSDGSASEFGTCYNHTENNANVIINCTVVMRYYDNASSSWVINISVEDISGLVGRNDSNSTIPYNFTYNQLSAMTLSSGIINFTSAYVGQNNLPAGGVSVILNNTGNDDFDQINITGAAYIGVDITSQSIAASQFFVNYTNAVDGAGMPLSTSGQTIRLLEQSAADRLDNLTLPHGHTSAKTTYNDNVISAKGNQSLYFWVDIPSSGLSSQKYNNTWNISVIDLP